MGAAITLGSGPSSISSAAKYAVTQTAAMNPANAAMARQLTGVAGAGGGGRLRKRTV